MREYWKKHKLMFLSRILQIKSSDNNICWDYFRVLFDLDMKHAANARVCPKITQRHIQLDNPSKMRVRLATQVLFHLYHRVFNPYNLACPFND